MKSLFKQPISIKLRPYRRFTNPESDFRFVQFFLYTLWLMDFSRPTTWFTFLPAYDMYYLFKGTVCCMTCEKILQKKIFCKVFSNRQNIARHFSPELCSNKVESTSTFSVARKISLRAQNSA